MGNRSGSWRALCLWLITMLLPAVFPQPAVAARTISNTAFVQWSSGSGTRHAASNQVDLDFSAPAELRTFTPVDGLVPAALVQSSCGGSGVSSSASRQASPISSIALASAPSLFAGRSVVLSLSSSSANVDPSSVDMLKTEVRTTTGDRETVTFVETGPNTGTFLALLASAPMPPAAVQGDCKLSVESGTSLGIELSDASGMPFAATSLSIVGASSGISFDSTNGAAVSGVRITIVDASTGQPAVVFGDDGHSRYPSTLVSGQPVTDSGGTNYSFAVGDYRFPLLAPGTYRLLVEPIAPYSFASTRSAAQLAALHGPDGSAFTIGAGSFGQPFTLASASSVDTDLPLDRPVTPLVISKSVNRANAAVGDLLGYQIKVLNPGALASGSIRLSDHIPAQMRYREGSARLGGKSLVDPKMADDRSLTFALPALAAGASETLAYVLEVRPDAASGDALNEAQAAADGASSNKAEALVRIENDVIANRFTIFGQVLGGGCSPTLGARGVPGIRVMLEDGSYAISDRDGRFHFEALKPGTHVVELDRGTVPEGVEAVDCAADVRSGGRGGSRFVDGFGGALKQVDFHLAPAPGGIHGLPPATQAIRFQQSPVDSDAVAAGAERDWLAGQVPGAEFLFPTAATNPRSPVTRVVIKHLPGQHVTLLVNGRPAERIAFDGTVKSASGDVAVSVWRGISLTGGSTAFRAEVRGAGGVLVTTLERTVVFANEAAHVELLRDRSLLLADGIHRPVLAFRITDRGGHPVHQGLAGDFELPAPYYPAMEADAQQARQLAGLERARPTWHVAGDDGIAYVELEPTTASGTVSLRFPFHDHDNVREERLEAWLSPGERKWTIVGLAEGTVGFNRLDKHLEKIGDSSTSTLTDGRLALYAKGRILGRWLLTLAYDSKKHEADERFGGVIDPQLYYTVYADRSERRYDAASIRKLYLRLETAQFYALFGDFDTGIDEPVLARYVRSENGAKAEYRSRQVAALAFAADTPLTHRREEIQGNGLSGPYALRSRGLLANSERVTIQTRDRFRSEKIVDEQLLTRNIDYDIDYQHGRLVFRSPVLSRSSALDPQFIIVEYDLDAAGSSTLNAGARVSWRSSDKHMQVGATAIHDDDGTTKTDLVASDVKIRVTTTTEVRAEAAASRAGTGTLRSAASTAWLFEVEHHESRLDVLAYAGERGAAFGLGQTNVVENGTRKVGLEARLRVDDHLSLSGSAWRHKILATGADSKAARLLAEYRSGSEAAHAGLTFAHDDLADGGKATSTLLDLGVSRRMGNGRLELGADSQIPLGGAYGTVDFPSRHRLTARFSASRWAALIASYEIASGDAVKARTARLGFDLTPWAGAHIALSGNVQDIGEYGPRSFAAIGLQQSIILSKHWSIDASLDQSRTLGGIDAARIVEPLQPAASGGYVGNGNLITEDFTAMTAGATYRNGPLSVTGRGEYRAGDLEDRLGLIVAAIRQIGEGRALAGALNWYRAHEKDGSVSSVGDASLTWANRPSSVPLTWLDKLELRRDLVSGALPGSTDPLGNALTVTGNARSVRMINSLSLNYDGCRGRCELALFWSARYVSDLLGDDDVGGFSSVLAADVRQSFGRYLELGAAASLRAGVDGRALAYSFGPQLSIRPAANSWMVLGYNVVGYRDRDFAAERFTRAGAYVTLRFKFDELSLANLALGQH